MFNNKIVLVTSDIGSFGKAFIVGAPAHAA
jgi:hypothetical protein